MVSSIERHSPQLRPDAVSRNPDAAWLDVVAPSRLGPWLGAFALFERIDSHCFNWVIRASELGRAAPDWQDFSNWVVDRGCAEWTAQGRPTLVMSRDWVNNARAILLSEPGWHELMRATLVETWLKVPDQQFLETVATWSRDLGRWDLLDRIWRGHLADAGGSRHSEALAVFRALPDSARRQHPALTWAMALAESRSSDQPLRIALRTVIRDGVLLHSTWYLNEDLDAAVFAGSIWMFCQRMLPADGRSRALQASARTGAAVERTIAEHAERGITPGDSVRTIFAVVMAHTALGTGDLRMAASMGGLATILKGAGSELEVVARGIVQLSLALGGIPPLDLAGVGGDVRSVHDRTESAGLVSEAGLVMLRLADGLRALDRLDRRGCEQALFLVRREDAWGACVGTVHAYLEAVHGALWVSPERALADLDAAMATNAGRSPEALEPLGERLIGRARAFILDRLGAADAAKAAAAELPRECRGVAQARAHLFAGEAGEATRFANGALLDSRTWLKDRVQLTVLKNAAVLMDPIATAEEMSLAARTVLETAIRDGSLLPLALPRKLRATLLDRARKAWTGLDAESLRDVEARLSELVDVAEAHASRVELTQREQSLLPLLATPDPVPEIAKSLHLSPNTVRKQVVGLRGKFQAGNRAELIRNARQAGYLR